MDHTKVLVAGVPFCIPPFRIAEVLQQFVQMLRMAIINNVVNEEMNRVYQ